MRRLSRRALLMACTAMAGLMGGACDDPEFGPWGWELAHRRKLTLYLTIDGRETEYFNIVEYRFRAKIGGITGEAIAIPIQPGRVLFVLLRASSIRKPNYPKEWTQRGRWGQISVIFSIPRHDGERGYKYTQRIVAARGVRDIGLIDLPDLATFGDLQDPNSVRIVDPKHLTEEFGVDVEIHRATIELLPASKEYPITTGIEAYLPWLSGLQRDYLIEARRKSVSKAAADLYFDIYFKVDLK